MDLTIHAYGYGETIGHALQALAMIRNSMLYPTMINTIALMLGVYYSWQMAASRVEGEWRQYLAKVGGMIILINCLLLPKTSMNVKDHVEKQFWVVDNIPLAFALPVGIVENVGHLVTMSFEQAFSLVGGRASFNYYNHGTVFGARLAKEVMQAQVRNPEYVSNMKDFIERCVILPAMIGEQFTKEELVATKDMWGLVSSRAGTFTRTPMTIYGIRQSPSPTCKEAVPYFEKIMSDSGLGDITQFSWKFKGVGNGTVYNLGFHQLNDNLQRQINALYNDETKVEEILKHNMMINALNEYRSGQYSYVKAQLAHEAGGLMSGDLAERLLTGALATMKTMVYGSFIFLVPLMIMSGGFEKYKWWIMTCLSLQLWPALFAMMNMMIDYAYEPAKIVSYSGWSTEIKKFDSMASIAAHMTLLIPFLAVWVTNMAQGSFTHLAGSVLSTASSAVSMGSSAQASGGRNHDNEAMNNSSRDNVNANKYDTGMQYVARTSNTMQSDGSMQKILPNGNVVSVGGAGTTSSTGESSYRESEGISTALQTGLRAEMQEASSTSANYVMSKESLVSKEASALTTIAENTRTDSGYNIDTSTDEGRDLVKTLNTIDRITENNDYSWRQNAEAHLKSDFTLGGQVAKFFGANISGGTNIGAENASSQLDGQAFDINEETGTTGKSGISTKTSEHSAWLESKGVDKNQQQSMRESFTETKRLEQAKSMHQDKIDSYNKAIDHTRTSGSEYSKDMYQEVIGGYKQRFNCSDADAQKAVSQGTVEAKEVFRTISGGRADAILNRIDKDKNSFNNPSAVEDFQKEYEDKVNPNIGDKVNAFAQEQGMMDASVSKQHVSDKREDLKNNHDINHERIDNKFLVTNTEIKAQKENKQNNIDKLEENRIGTGAISSVVGGLGRQSKNSELPMPEFDEISRPYKPNDESKSGIYNWETGKIDPYPENETPRHLFKAENIKVSNGQYVDRELLKSKKD